MNAMASLITGVSIVYILAFVQAQILKYTSKLRVTGLCGGNSPVTDDFPAQWASNAENDSISWRHHDGVKSQVFWVHQLKRWFLQ